MASNRGPKGALGGCEPLDSGTSEVQQGIEAGPHMAAVQCGGTTCQLLTVKKDGKGQGEHDLMLGAQLFLLYPGTDPKLWETLWSSEALTLTSRQVCAQTLNLLSL